MLITEIVLDPTRIPAGDPLRFRMGEPVVAGGFAVAKIVYNKYAYNMGYQGEFPAYAVSFDGIEEKRIIRADVVTNFEVLNDEKDKKKKIVAEGNIQLPN